MIVLLDKESLFSTFGVNSFDSLDEAINSMAPSMVEYYLSDLTSFNEEEIYLNKRSIQKSLFFGDYSIYLDYEDDCFLELSDEIQEEETASFW